MYTKFSISTSCETYYFSTEVYPCQNIYSFESLCSGLLRTPLIHGHVSATGSCLTDRWLLLTRVCCRY